MATAEDTTFPSSQKALHPSPQTRRRKPKADLTSDQSLVQLSAQDELTVERHVAILLTPTSAPKNCHFLLPL